MTAYMSTGIRVLTSDINDDESEPSIWSLLRVPPVELSRADPTRPSPDEPSTEGCFRSVGSRAGGIVHRGVLQCSSRRCSHMSLVEESAQQVPTRRRSRIDMSADVDVVNVAAR